MAQYCSVNGCNSNTSKCRTKHISLFHLPKNEIMREAWLQRIGESHVSNKKNALVCSLHFSEDSFTVPKKKSKVAENKRRRHLLQSAVPTLFLSPTENRTDNIDTENIDFKIIRRQFPLVCSTSTSKDLGDENQQTSSGINAVNKSCDNVTFHGTNEIDGIASTPIVDPLLDESSRVTRTPPIALHTRTTEPSCTSPRRSQRFEPYADYRRASTLTQHKQHVKTPLKTNVTPEAVACSSRENTPLSARGQRSKRFEPYADYRRASTLTQHKQNIKTPLKTNVTPEAVACFSMKNTPLSARGQRFCMKNCDESIDSSGPKATEMSDLQADVALLKTELRHCRSLHEFHMQSNCRDFAMQTSLEAEKEALKRQLQEKDDQLEQACAEKEEMLKLISDLQLQLATTKLDETTRRVERDKYVTGLLKPYFTEGQVRCILEKRKWIQWSIDDYAAAISLRSVSPKAYHYLQTVLHYPLPSLSSLRRWAFKKFHIEEGFLTDVLAVMREKGKELSSLEKCAVLIFDEMAVSSEVNSDAELEKLVTRHGKVQVMMVRGLFSTWNQPIFYRFFKFDRPINKCILMEAITLLHNADYQVVAIVSDMDNRGAWGELDISLKKYFFHHPVNEEEKVFVFADVPHLLKLLRNWFLDDGLLLGNCDELFTREIFHTLVDMSSDGDLRVDHRITQQLLDVRGLQRQSIEPAAKIWSHTAAKAIQLAGRHGLLKTSEYERFSEFVSTVNKWFDVHNSKSQYGLHPGVNGYGQDLATQESVLMLMSSYIENMRVGSRKALMPFQNGILVSNQSLRGLFQYLQRKYAEKCQYVITRKLQHDILENFFDYIRGSCQDYPSPYDFKYRLRWYVLGKHTQAVFTLNKNTEEDIDTCSIVDMTNRSAEEQPTTSATPAVSAADENIFTFTPIQVQGMTLYVSQTNDSCLQEEEELKRTE